MPDRVEVDDTYLADVLSSIFERFGRVIHLDGPPESSDENDVTPVSMSEVR